MEDNVPHNKWREKLNSIPPPQGKEAWNSMEVLLDQHLPVQRRRSWPYIAILTVLLLLVLGICNCPQLQHKPLVTRNSGSVGKEVSSQLDNEEEKNSTNNTTNKNKVLRQQKPFVIESKQNEENLANEPIRTRENPINKKVQNKEQQKNKENESWINPSATSNVQVSTDLKSPIKLKNSKSFIKDSPKKDNDAAFKATTLSFDQSPIKQPPLYTKDTLATAATKNTKDTSTTSTLKTGIKLKDSTNNNNNRDPLKRNQKKWAIGLGYNYFLAIDGQKRVTYSDWKGVLPIFQTRFYFNSQVYLQAELQWHAPQYMKEYLVSRTISSIPSVPGTTSLRTNVKSTFVSKLFYTDAPVSIHTSPLKNLFLGAGIQYSSLQKAIGLQEHKIIAQGRPDSILSTTTAVIDKTVTKETFHRGQTRFLLAVDAKLKRFNVGVQYNQSFKSYMKNPIQNTPNPSPKNTSLHVFIRYQLKGF